MPGIHGNVRVNIPQALYTPLSLLTSSMLTPREKHVAKNIEERIISTNRIRRNVGLDIEGRPLNWTSLPTFVDRLASFDRSGMSFVSISFDNCGHGPSSFILDLSSPASNPYWMCFVILPGDWSLAFYGRFQGKLALSLQSSALLKNFLQTKYFRESKNTFYIIFNIHSCLHKHIYWINSLDSLSYFYLWKRNLILDILKGYITNKILSM